MLLTLGTLVLVLLLVLISRQRAEERAAIQQESESTADPSHHAVYIKYDPRGCCWAVRALGSKKFLSDEAPGLPLPECDRQQTCQCVFRHLQDRRSHSGGRRATDRGFGEPLYYGPERRSGKDRRAEEPEEGSVPAFTEPRDYFLR